MRYERAFTIGLREVRDFHIALALSGAGKAILGSAAVGALVVLLYLPETVTGVMRWMVVIFAAAAAALAVLLGVVLVTGLRVNARVRRSGREQYLQRVEIDGFGVHVTAAGQKTAKLGFDKLLRVQETHRAFYLYLTPNQAWILPKRQMSDALEVCQVREIFNAVIESKRLKLQA